MRPLVQIHLYCDPIFSSEASGQQQTGVRVYALEKFLRRAAFGRLCLKKSASNSTAEKYAPEIEI
jgi:hypothetical protein